MKHRRTRCSEENTVVPPDRSICNGDFDSDKKQLSMRSFFTSVGKRKRPFSVKKATMIQTPYRTPPSPFKPKTPRTPPTTQELLGISTPPTCPVKEGPISPSIQPTASKKQRTKMRQMYIDLGQRDFGKQCVCEVCGMLFVQGVAEDIREHNRVCRDYMDGISFRNSSSREVATFDNGRVVEVRPSDSYTLRQKVRRVKAIVDKELGFVEVDDSPRTTYLFISNTTDSVVGVASAEIIKRAFVFDCETRLSSSHSRRAMVGIRQIWVHRSARRMKVATKLVDTIRDKFVFGMCVPVEMVAFSSPSESGALFAQNYRAASCNSVLVYDLLSERTSTHIA